jgi:hypothetical protein
MQRIDLLENLIDFHRRLGEYIRHLNRLHDSLTEMLLVALDR